MQRLFFRHNIFYKPLNDIKLQFHGRKVNIFSLNLEIW